MTTLLTVLVVGELDEGALGNPGDLVVHHARFGERHQAQEIEGVDAVVLMATDAHDLRRLQVWHRAHAGAGAVVVVPVGDPGGVGRALVYTPGIPADVQVVEGADRTLVDVVRATASRSSRMRRHREVVRTLVERPRSPGPSFAPTADALAAVVDRAPLGLLTVDDDAALVGWNARAAVLLSLTGRDVGAPLSTVLLSAETIAAIAGAGSARSEVFTQAAVSGAARRADVVMEINAIATDLGGGRHGTLLLLLDVSEQRAAEVARDELSDRLRVVRRSQEFLLRASDVLAQADDYVATLEQLAGVAVPTLGDICLIDVLEDGRLRRVAARHADPAKQELVNVLKAHYAPSPGSDHPAALALRDRRAQWAFEVDRDWLEGATQDARHLDVVRRLGFTGWIAVPLVAGGEALGVVTLVAGSEGRLFGPDDVVLADELAGRVAQVVAKARRYDREHEIAVALQRSMLTALPDLSPLEVAARYLPALRDTQVGGDWYDVFVQPGRPPVVVIGDVVGHDLSAATAMGQVRHAMRALAWGRSDRPVEVLTAFDEFNEGVRITDFATVLYGVVEPRTGSDGGGATFRWTSAGHLPPLLVDADETARYLQADQGLVVGLPAGLRPRVETSVEMPPGSTLLLYTDGLVERRGESLTVGLAELRLLVADLVGLPLEQLCDEVLAARAGARDDDIAILAVRLP